MPNNGNDWNRNREGSIQNWNDNDRNRRNRENDYEGDEYNRRERNFGGQMGYGSGYNAGRDRDDDYGENRGRYSGDMNRGGYSGEGRDWNRGDDWNRSSEFGRGSDWNRSSDWNRGNDWNRNRGYSGSGSRDYDDRYGSERNRGNDRSWWSKTKDEVSSWFGDDDAERRRRMDERGEYRGKGPKGYTRSDDRIKEDVNDRLSDDPMVDASDIDVSVNNAEVTLTGTVSDRSQKRRAEDIAESISGVKNVENRIKVGTSSNMGSSTSNMGSSSGTTGSGSTNMGSSATTGSSTSGTSRSTGTNSR